MSLDSKIKVAVLRGGPSNQYAASLASGEHVLSLLREKPESYEPLDIFISKEGDWHHMGLVDSPYKLLRKADVVFNALHGSFGEDGEVQKILEEHRVPFTGSGVASSLFALNKELSKRAYKLAGISTPEGAVVTQENVDEGVLVYIFRTLLHPVIIKPVLGTASEGIRIARTFPELEQTINELLEIYPKLLIEEYIKGKDVSCVVLEGARGEELYALLPVEIGEQEYFSPGNFPRETGKKIEEMARSAHKALGLRHYSHSDFIVTPKGNLYILETNSQPNFAKDSSLHHSLEASGWKAGDLVEHLVKMGME